MPSFEQTILADINNAGEIVGNVYGSGNAHGFRYSAGVFTLIDAPGAAGWTFASGINDAGDIVGSYYDTKGISHGYLYRAGSFTTLDVPAARETWAQSINNTGQIVGRSRGAPSGGGFRDLGFLYTSGAFSTLRVHTDTYPNGINDVGTIVGQYTQAPEGDIPEPASVLLFGAGLVGICAVRLCKRSRYWYKYRSHSRKGKRSRDLIPDSKPFASESATISSREEVGLLPEYSALVLTDSIVARSLDTMK